MTRAALEAVLARAAAGWREGDAAAVADCFAVDVEYTDPVRYRFDRRDQLVPFFEPPPGGHDVTWHAILWDEAAGTGAVEYTYEGHHRYHGAAIVGLNGEGRIALWREWQHLADDRDWTSMIAGPPASGSLLAGIDHVQLGMPAAGEDAARAFYRDLLGLREVPKPRALAGRGGVWFAGPDVALHLGVETPFRPAAKAHPGFVVGDLVTTRTRLAAAGIETRDDDSGLPLRRCYLDDPFGNRLELIDAADAGFSART
ncbi:MAG: VOC family protein [Candidatus Limnocylindrales bacterium]